MRRCSPVKAAQNAIRFFFFPASRYISEKTIEIDQKLESIRKQHQVTTHLVEQVNQPDILRTLVTSMQNSGKRQ